MTTLRQVTAQRRAFVSVAAATVVAIVAMASYFVVSASAAPPPPTPVITSSPSNPSSNTTAHFTYTDSLRQPTFQCSLDGSKFRFCPAGGATLYGLSAGSHTFEVEAGPAGGPYSSPATYTWQVEPPTATIKFPANGGAYNAAGWSAGCKPAGICGTAAAFDGISSVAVSIYQVATNKYWNGSSFSSTRQIFNTATGTTSWHYAFVPPRNGSYTVAVQARDDDGSTSCLVRATFTYNTKPPPAPLIISKPANPSPNTSPEFNVADAYFPNVTFSCRLDSGPVVPCSGDTDHDGDRTVEGEVRYHGLTPGSHCFYVYVTDPEGNVSPTTSYCWTISVAASNFTVGGNLTSPLYPGVSESLDMTFTNPNSSPITIASGGVTASNIAITTNKVGCGASNFAVTQGLTASVTIPANQVAPVSLSSLLIPQSDWPVIEMIDTHTNQDACQGAQLTLTYSGIEATG